MKVNKIRLCAGDNCEQPVSKNKWGNWNKYCCPECSKATANRKRSEAQANLDQYAVLAKRKATNTAKYGVDNASKDPAIRARLAQTTKATAEIRTRKTKETNMRNHGVESTNSLDSVKAKKKQTCLDKYGVDHPLKDPDVRDRKEQTTTERYGSKTVLGTQKARDGLIRKYGVDNASQVAEVQEKKVKNCFKSKDYIMPSGTVHRVQGYEPQALDLLLKDFSEEQIVLGLDVPVIWYEYNGRQRRYFPDIYIPCCNLIVEVKSDWTYERDLDVNLAKQAACIAAGYNFEFMIL